MQGLVVEGLIVEELTNVITKCVKSLQREI